MELVPLLGAFGAVVVLVGLGLLIRPSARLKVPTRKRAALVLATGFALFITALVVSPRPEPKVLVTSPSTAPQAVSPPTLLQAPPATLSQARLAELVASSEVAKRGYKLTAALSLDNALVMTVNLDLEQRLDGLAAEFIGRTIAEAIIKELVATGANPRTQPKTIRVRVLSNDAPKSVTGAEQRYDFGAAVYRPDEDKIVWQDNGR